MAARSTAGPDVGDSAPRRCERQIATISAVIAHDVAPLAAGYIAASQYDSLATQRQEWVFVPGGHGGQYSLGV